MNQLLDFVISLSGNSIADKLMTFLNFISDLASNCGSVNEEHWDKC